MITWRAIPARLVAATAFALSACGDPSAPRERAGLPDPEAARWQGWVLPAPDALRPPPPPARGSAEERREIEELLALQRARGEPALREVARFAGTPSLAWSAFAVDRLGFYWPLLPDVRIATPAQSARVMALLHVAMYDALLATWDAKLAYVRAAPGVVEAGLHPVEPVTDAPSYPSEHAAVAGAAAAVLAYALPLENPAALDSLARAAAESRITAGMAYRSDAEAGLALGRAVAARVIARARTDGADAAWTGSVPVADGAWRPTPPRRVQVPFDPSAGGWRTWVIPSGDAFRPEPPPAAGSPRFERDLAELRTLSVMRTRAQADLARYWATEAPSARWELFMLDELRARRLSPVRAARAQALASVAAYDAMVACWDAKFRYWLARPITADPSVVTVFSTPPFPSYPSGHSTLSSAMAEVFAEIFPDSSAAYHRRAEEASLSRVLGGVHYRFDIEAGEQLGLAVGRAVVARMRADGSSPPR